MHLGEDISPFFHCEGYPFIVYEYTMLTTLTLVSTGCKEENLGVFGRDFLQLHINNRRALLLKHYYSFWSGCWGLAKYDAFICEVFEPGMDGFLEWLPMYYFFRFAFQREQTLFNRCLFQAHLHCGVHQPKPDNLCTHLQFNLLNLWSCPESTVRFRPYLAASYSVFLNTN